ncbi:MAG: tetratricopeptide repeat protein [Aquificae bacterium]|nr:tetratricopeptide repeat protein [Aquificota bacterium]
MNRLEYFKKLLEQSPDNPMVHYSLGLEYQKMGNWEKAIEHLERYLTLKEDEGAVYRYLARCYEAIGDYEKAIRALEEGIRQAVKYNHPSMAEEYRNWIEQLKSSF